MTFREQPFLQVSEVEEAVHTFVGLWPFLIPTSSAEYQPPFCVLHQGPQNLETALNTRAIGRYRLATTMNTSRVGLFGYQLSQNIVKVNLKEYKSYIF
jgi:hypothetical protein